MIATAAQHQVAQDRIRRFSESLEKIESDPALKLRELHIRAIQDQIRKLQDSISDYEQLLGGDVEKIEVERVADLPMALVRGRLVAGLSQRELARLAQVAPPQIEQWERDGYSRAPLSVMQRIARHLPLEFQGAAAAIAPSVSDRAAKRSLRQAGLPGDIFDRVIAAQGVPDFASAEETDQRVKALFGAGIAEFVAGRQFEAAPLRFKLPANAAQDRTRAYAAYVDGMCAIVTATQRLRSEPLPQDWREIRALFFPRGRIDLRTALRRCWSLGIGVLPLRDSVAFHGACRRVEGRATIVLKQRSRHHSRWLFDLMHEIFHLVAETSDFTLIEAAETALERRTSRDERRANRFAAMILTDGQIEDALTDIVRQSRGAIERLSGVVEQVAHAYAIPLGILANLVAENVQTSSGRRWWGVAENLQPDEDDPWKIARDVFIEEANLAAISATQRDLLRSVLETPDE